MEIMEAPPALVDRLRGSSATQVPPTPERDVSDLLAEKMLEGWALLQRPCPRCVAEKGGECIVVSGLLLLVAPAADL